MFAWCPKLGNLTIDWLKILIFEQFSPNHFVSLCSIQRINKHENIDFILHFYLYCLLIALLFMLAI